MSKGISFEIKQDTITDYLNKLEEHYQQTQEAFLDELAMELTTDYIEKYVPVWKGADSEGNLLESGEDPSNWFKSVSMERSVLEVLYTGFTELMEHSHVFFEMGGSSTHAYRSLKRDYAYYQETGKDLYHVIANYGQAPDFGGHHYVQKGTQEFVKSDRMGYKTAQYLKEIMNLR